MYKYFRCYITFYATFKSIPIKQLFKCIKPFPFANFNRKVYLNLSCPFSFVNAMDAVGSGNVPTLLCFTVALEHVYLKLHRSLPGVDLACEEGFRKGHQLSKRTHDLSLPSPQPPPHTNPLLLLSKEK